MPLPDGVSPELAASLGVPAMTAHRCLFADGPVDGQAVLVAGGAGAVGHFSIQLANWGNAAQVLATVSGPAKAQLAKEAGAADVINYHERTRPTRSVRRRPVRWTGSSRWRWAPTWPWTWPCPGRTRSWSATRPRPPTRCCPSGPA